MQEERDDIEKFFAKRLGEKEFPFEEEQWEVLAERLDHEMPVRAPFWLWLRKRLAYILIPIITFLIGWYWQRGTEQPLENEVPVEAPIEVPANPEKPMDIQPQNTPNSVLLQEQSAQESRELTSQAVIKESVAEAKVFQRGVFAANEAETEARQSVPPIGSRSLTYYEIAPLSMLELDFPMAQLGEGIFVPVGDSTVNKEEKTRPNWSVTLLAAPDFSSTNIKDLYNSLGQTVGLQFNRSAGEKMQWGFGFLLNNKIYTAGKGEYSPSRAYSGPRVEPDMTDAKCLVLEIPVSFGMRLFETKRGSVWANAGLSSYIFLTERYSYYYDTYDPDQPTGWEGKNENRHFAAGLGFSFLYAHTLSEKFSLVVEPYFKSTIQPVGHGNVDLLSTGLNVGLNYRFFSNN